MGLVDGSFEPSFRVARAKPMEAVFDPNSPNCFNTRGAGFQVTKEVTLTDAGAPVNVNLFTVTGVVALFRIFGVFIDVTNVDDIEDVKLDVYDGTVAEDVTNTAGVVCDLCALNSVLFKGGDATAALILMNADRVRIHEPTKSTVLEPVLINQKNAATTYLRVVYTNTDTNLNCQIKWYAEWRSFCGSPGAMVAV